MLLAVIFVLVSHSPETPDAKSVGGGDKPILDIEAISKWQYIPAIEDMMPEKGKSIFDCTGERKLLLCQVGSGCKCENPNKEQCIARDGNKWYYCLKEGGSPVKACDLMTDWEGRLILYETNDSQSKCEKSRMDVQFSEGSSTTELSHLGSVKRGANGGKFKASFHFDSTKITCTMKHPGEKEENLDSKSHELKKGVHKVTCTRKGSPPDKVYQLVSYIQMGSGGGEEKPGQLNKMHVIIIASAGAVAGVVLIITIVCVVLSLKKPVRKNSSGSQPGLKRRPPPRGSDDGQYEVRKKSKCNCFA